MRPRFMNRGSGHPNQLLLSGSYGFNEAPIHESGKSVIVIAICQTSTMASMRPRFMNRGS